ncbi:hypothetical protein E4U54_003982 [Claviceps lovelessii]|nr:hypothetical protein E4U54_003982 [Claviceps lovelessii]
MHTDYSTKSCSATQNKNSSIGSFPKRNTKALFAGPPPPIAASIIVRGQSSRVSAYDFNSNSEPDRLAQTMESLTGSVMSNQPRKGFLSHYQKPDSVWFNIRRRQRILEDNIQQLLDFQSSGLTCGLQLDELRPSSVLHNDSDSGSSTPTGTLQSTVTSRSKMQRNLNFPPQSTLEGNVVPVRQPVKARPPGLRAARNGLGTAIESLKELRREEKAHIVAAIKERKSALQRLDDLSSRRLGILSELTAYDDDGELRELGESQNFVDQKISRLEEQLAGLRKQRLQLRDKMRDIQEKREAGLSGYRGALRDVDSELSTLMRLPPVLPLEPAIQGESCEALYKGIASAGGPGFLSLKPERRTPELAKAWWAAELAVLEKRSIEVDEEMQALDEGSALWRDVLSLVSGFESDLRQAMKGKLLSKLNPSAKGKEKAYTVEESIRSQVSIMGNVLTELEHAMELAEANRWNLLICAIGAELEAFGEALGVLTTLLLQENEPSSNPLDTAQNGGRTASTSHHDVPQGVYNSLADDTNPRSANTATTTNMAEYDDRGYDNSQSQASENEIPLEFLGDHGQ